MPNFLLKTKNFFLIGLLLLGLNFYVWRNIVYGVGGSPEAGFYFLDVGQGDSELVVFSSGAKMKPMQALISA